MNKNIFTRHNRKPKASIFLIGMTIIITLFCINFISAAEWDNIKGTLVKDATTSQYGKIDIYNWNIIGKIFDIKTATLELKKNTDICGVDCNSETQIILYQDTVLIDSVKFIGAEVKDYKFYIQTGEKETGKIIDDYGKICNGDLNKTCRWGIIGSHPETTPIWEEYKIGTEMKAGTYNVKLEGTKDFYSSTDWIITSQGKEITEWADWGAGGDITYYTDFVVHTYRTSGYFNVTTPGTLWVLVVAGGGGGGAASPGAGGGAGGLINTTITITAGNYPIIVGDGGASAQNGTNSSAFGLEAMGGGAGGSATSFAGEQGSGGGSGGGAMAWDTAVGSGTGGFSIPGQGNRGGNAVPLDNEDYITGGGGGAGGQGQDITGTGSSGLAGNGGAGLLIGINGSNIYYAGGGGGGIYPAGSVGLGGSGVGGDGSAGGTGGAGLANSGSGGGGGNVGGAGGSGIVIIRYPKTNNVTSSVVITTLNSPEDNFISDESTVIFNCSANVSSISGIGLSNISLWLNTTGNWILNETIDVSGTYNNSIFTKNISDGVNYGWTCKAVDNSSSYAWATNRTFSVDTIHPIFFIAYPENISYNINVSTMNYTFEHPSGTMSKCWYSIDGGINNGTPVTCGTNFSSLSSFEGSNTWTVYGNDTAGNEGSRSVTFFKDTIFPQIKIVSPANNTNTTNVNLNINYTRSDLNLASCWYSKNSGTTNITLPGCINITSETWSTGINNIIIWVNDTVGNTNSSSVTFNNINPGIGVYINNVFWDEPIYETSQGLFTINVTYNSTIYPSIEALFYYNGTNYPIARQFTGNNFAEFEVDIIIPLINVSSQTKNFYWNFNLINGSTTTVASSSVYTQTINRIYLGYCNAERSILALNITAYNETDLFRISPFNIAGSINYALTVNSPIYRIFDFTNNSIDEMEICINSSSTHYLRNFVEYSNPNYQTKDYYFINYPVDGVVYPRDLYVYMLPSSLSTSFILKVQDQNFYPLIGYFIDIYRYNPGNSTPYLVQVTKTDINGQTIGFLQTETVDYKFVIKDPNGTIVYTADHQKAIPQSTPYTITFTVGSALPSPLIYLANLTDLTYSLDYDPTTFRITFTYTDLNSSFSLGKLIVSKGNFSGLDSNICIKNSTSSSAIIICDITGNSTGSYYATGYVYRGSQYFVDRINFEIENFSSTVGLLGVFGAWLIILICASLFLYNEVAGIICVNLGIIFVNIIGMVHFGGVYISAILGVSILLLIILERG